MEKLVMYPNKISPNSTWGPYDWIFQANWGFDFIKYPEKICDPSSGEIGIMLKTANEIFICVKNYYH